LSPGCTLSLGVAHIKQQGPVQANCHAVDTWPAPAQPTCSRLLRPARLFLCLLLTANFGLTSIGKSEASARCRARFGHHLPCANRSSPGRMRSCHNIKLYNQTSTWLHGPLIAAYTVVVIHKSHSQLQQSIDKSPIIHTAFSSGFALILQASR
jgi:hypothetical protein